ncbi:MAG: FliM/FliN family flagellar motor switch protein [Proteocatella sp.]
MAEVLSQSQIDLILNSMKDGGDVAENKEQQKEELGYKKYDFYSPKKFTRDKLKLLNNIYENYSRILSSKAGNLFRINSEFEVLGVEEQRYYEFSNAVNDNDILTFVELEASEVNKEIPILMHVNNRLMLGMIDRILGGDGEDIEISTDYKYTDVERSLYDHIMERLAPNMKEAWSNYIDGNFKYENSKMNQNVGQIIGMDETVVIIIINAKIGLNEGQMTVCIPGTLLSLIFEIHEQENVKSKGSKYSKEDEIILNNIKTSDMELKVRLGESEMSMKDAYNLRVGDTINLGRPQDSDVYVYVDDSIWFTGKLGVHKKNVAVKIKQVKQ